METSDGAAYRCCEEYESYRRSLQRLRPSRRTFLKTAVGVVAGTAVLPHLLLDAALADQLATGDASAPILVVIQLAGGNDGLNTVVPYGSDLYYHDRPTIAVPARSVLPIDHVVGFNPNLAPLKPLFDAGKLAIIQGVGYPNPDRSHFRSTSIWETADPVGTTQTGWLGRYLDLALVNDPNPLKAMALGATVPQTLVGEHTAVPSIENVQSFRFLVGRQDAGPLLSAYRTMYGGSLHNLPPYVGLVRQVERNADQGVHDMQTVALNYKPSVKYGTDQLSRELQMVAQFISSDLGTRLFHVTLGGFDDHAAEVYTHANLLKSLGNALAAFYADLQNMGKADQVAIMTFSEFGRRVKENGGRGTDHGTAAPLFVLGGKIKGGVYGDDPILNQLDSNGDLRYGIDFLSVYGTILDGWLQADSRSVLGAPFERLPFL